MARAIRAELERASVIAMGRTAPNPAVACAVLDVSNGEARLYSGATEPAGQRHAEIVALDNLAGAMPVHSWVAADARDSRTLFVTLEPCSRVGRTPACTTRIVQDPALGAVVYGLLDPTLGGEGVQLLTNEGRIVRSGVTASRIARAFLTGFVSRVTTRGPRFHLKAASTADGLMADPARTRRLLISSPAGFAFGMLLRAKVDAVVAGPGTLAIDRPSLQFRSPAASELTQWERVSGRDRLCDLWIRERGAALAAAEQDASYQPARVLLLGRDFPGSGEYLAGQLELARAGGGKVILVSLSGGAFSEQALTQRIEAAGLSGAASCQTLPRLSDPDFPRELRAMLAFLGLNEVLVEGGPRLHVALAPGLQTGDRLLWLAREEQPAGAFPADSASAVAPAGAGEHCRLPDCFRQGTPVAVYRIGTDRLEVREL